MTTAQLTDTESGLESSPLPPIRELPLSEQAIHPEPDLSVLDLHDPTPLSLVLLFDKLHREHSHSLEFNRSWTLHLARLTFCAQRIINRCDEHMQSAFDLFTAAGIKVTLPNFFQRILYRFQRLKRAEVYKEKMLMNTARYTLALKRAQNTELTITAEQEIAKHKALEAEQRAGAERDRIRLYQLQTKKEEQTQRAENGKQIIELFESIQERIKENRKKDDTNNKIRQYNTLLEEKLHNLDPQKWKKMEYLSLDE